MDNLSKGIVRPAARRVFVESGIWRTAAHEKVFATHKIHAVMMHFAGEAGREVGSRAEPTFSARNVGCGRQSAGTRGATRRGQSDLFLHRGHFGEPGCAIPEDHRQRQSIRMKVQAAVLNRS